MGFKNDDLGWLFEGVDFNKLKNGRVLDLGWGGDSSILKRLAQKYGIIPYGVDLEGPGEDDNTRLRSRFNIAGEFLRQSLGLQKKERFVRGNILSLPFASGNFDLVYSTAVFPFLPLEDKLQGIKEAHRVLRNDGLGVIDFELYEDGKVWKPKPLEMEENLAACSRQSRGQITYAERRVADGDRFAPYTLVKVVIHKNRNPIHAH